MFIEGTFRKYINAIVKDDYLINDDGKKLSFEEGLIVISDIIKKNISKLDNISNLFKSLNTKYTNL